jgi:hypothetical protein
MKLKTVLSIAAIFSMTAVSSAFAVATFTDAGTDTIGTPSLGVKPSKNVKVLYEASSTTSGTGVITYSVSAYHTSGTKTFGSSSGDTKIFMIDGIGSAPAGAPAAGASANYSSWTAM